MFHKAIDLKLKTGTVLEVVFQSGEVKSYDMAVLFDKYPQLKALKKRNLFLQGKLIGAYGIVWNDDLDIETETIYNDGETVDRIQVGVNYLVAEAVSSARFKAGMSQKELADLTGIDQSDISKIERGSANPSINTLNRLAKAMNMELSIKIQ